MRSAEKLDLEAPATPDAPLLDPQAVAIAPQAQPLQQPDAARERQPEPANAFAALTNFKVMMVDDDPIMLEVVQTFLEEAGYSSFVTTSDPTQAMALFVAQRPDILLLDLMMPQVSGFDILGELRSHEELRYTPVIMLTAESEGSAKLKALELGATDFLLKPVDPSELRLRLRNALAFKAYQDRLSDFDALTGLPNRRKFQAELSGVLANAAEQRSRACALLHIDLDRFKQVNDTLGHRIGDKLLCGVAQMLVRIADTSKPSQFPGSDQGARPSVARIGGNGFAVLLPNLHNLAKQDDATAVARRILNTFAEPFHAEAHELFTTASIGIAVSPSDGQDAEALLKNAEMAMYQAKKRGRGGYEFFSGDMNAQALERLTLENQLRRAVEREEFVLYFQPKVEVASRRVAGVEALIRWKHPEQGIIAPQKFIPIAEETGLIVEIGQWVLRTACSQLQAWMQQGLPPMCVAVNVSGGQIKHGTIWHAVRGALERSGIPPSHLVLELTESILMENAEENVERLHELKDMGVKIAIDDFGTGYSSFTYLSRFPIDELKIDRSFIHGLTSQRGSPAIVGAMIALGRALNLQVVAEGVETPQQLEFLRARNCHQYQGFLCSRPVPPGPLTTLLQRSIA
ncbi:MAG TPA: EAL domain-containing protein [Burkholderiales bacterium]|jgi:diguanylate cyclase (GGDEF)-like protein